MALVQFNKLPLTYDQQIALLKGRGLVIDNEPETKRLLENISYYRLSGYWYPLLDNKQTHVFKVNANFRDAYNLYCCDNELKLLVLKEIEQIEIAIRAKMVYVLSLEHGAFWHENQHLFSSEKTYSATINNIEKECKRDEEFIKSFQKKYTNNLPPSWILTELISFGALSFLYSNLKPSIAKRTIANHFGLNEKTFASWVHSLVYMRNICAHHARLWNKDIRIQPVNPNKPKFNWLENKEVANNKSFYLLSAIAYLLQTVEPKNEFTNSIYKLLKRYPNSDVKAMGFPKEWKQEKLWQIK